MNRLRFSWRVWASLAIAGLGIVALPSIHRAAAAPNADAVDASAPAPSAGDNSVAAQIKEMQKQVADLQARLGGEHSPRIVAAGTATFMMRAEQDNATFTHVKLAADVAARLGNDYIVVISSRFPSGGYPFFTPYWKPAKDGFDATMVDPSLGPGGTASYTTNGNRTFPIDWIVVKK